MQQLYYRASEKTGMGKSGFGVTKAEAEAAIEGWDYGFITPHIGFAGPKGGTTGNPGNENQGTDDNGCGVWLSGSGGSGGGDGENPKETPKSQFESKLYHLVDGGGKTEQAGGWLPVPGFPNWWYHHDYGAGGADPEHWQFGYGKDPNSSKFQKFLRRIKRIINKDDDDDFTQYPHGKGGVDKDVPAEVIKKVLGIDRTQIEVQQPTLLDKLRDAFNWEWMRHESWKKEHPEFSSPSLKGFPAPFSFPGWVFAF